MPVGDWLCSLEVRFSRPGGVGLVERCQLLSARRDLRVRAVPGLGGVSVGLELVSLSSARCLQLPNEGGSQRVCVFS